MWKFPPKYYTKTWMRFYFSNSQMLSRIQFLLPHWCAYHTIVALNKWWNVFLKGIIAIFVEIAVGDFKWRRKHKKKFNIPKSTLFFLIDVSLGLFLMVVTHKMIQIPDILFVFWKNEISCWQNTFLCFHLLPSFNHKAHLIILYLRNCIEYKTARFYPK